MTYKIRFPRTFKDDEWNYENLDTIFGHKILNISQHPDGDQEIEFVDDMNPIQKNDIKSKLLAENDFGKKIKEK